MVFFVVGTLLALLLAADAARTRSSGSGPVGVSASGTDDSTFDAPPLAVATLVVYALLLFATVVQFAIAARALFRRGSRLPTVAVVTALVVLALAYALNVGYIVASYTYTYDEDGFPKIFGTLHLEVASIVFLQLKDLAMFAAVALILRHCYLSGKPSSQNVLMWFTGAAGVLFVAMVVFLAAFMGIFEATTRARQHLDISFKKAKSRFDTSDSLSYVFVVFEILTIFFLALSAFMIHTRVKNNTIMTLMLFGIVPSLFLFAAARIIFVILRARLPVSGFFTADVALELQLASTIIYGLIYLALTSLLVFIVSWSSLWSPKTASDAPPTQGAPPTHVYVQGMPPAQFPGQWGYPQQLAQQQGSFPQPQQYAYVPVYAVQNPGAQVPVNEKEPPTPPATT